MPEETEHHLVKCSNDRCGKTLRFKVMPTDYGKSRTIRCTVCKTEMRVVTPLPFRIWGRNTPQRELELGFIFSQDRSQSDLIEIE